MVTNVHRSSHKVHVTFIKFYKNLNCIDRFFENYAYIKFNENPSSGSMVIPCGCTDRQTDRLDEDNIRFS